MPDSIRKRWEGHRWRWWALAAGAVLVGITLLIAGAISLVREGEWASLALLGLTLELALLGVIGSGMLDGLSGRAIAGGMARQPLPDSRMARPTGAAPGEAEQRRRDRKTIRAGLIALPVFITFLILLFA